MSKRHWLLALMGITILGISGFQFYWLRENYDREKNSLHLKSEVTFRETIQDLQVSKLKLGPGLMGNDTLDRGKVKVFVSEGGAVKVTQRIKDQTVSSINVIRDRLDSMRKGGVKTGMVISMDKSTVRFRPDSGRFTTRLLPPPGEDHIFNFLYGVDSLQDSLRLPEIDSAYKAALAQEKLDVPYEIKRLDSTERCDEPCMNEVTVGIVHPVTYRMELGNTLTYLMKRISMPILFSVILLGITILSFVSLYRNLVRQQRLAELKNEFISNITHELKTPIATVGVAIEALKNFNAMQDPQKTREYLDISSNELHRLSLLVDKVLKLSMFEKKGIELKYESLNFEDLVNEVLNSLKLQLEKYHATVSVQKEGDLNFQGDRLHLLSVVFNLLDNSLKYRKEDPKIDIQLTGNDQQILVSVKDNGIGIPDEYKEKVFEKFFRVPHGDTHNAKGYGLGLSYASQVIKKHGGVLRCDSSPESGTTFTIELPKQKT